MIYMDYMRQFTTQSFSNNLDTLEKKGSVSRTAAETVKSTLFRARITNAQIFGNYNEVFFKTLITQSLLYLDQRHWFLVKRRTNISLSGEELLSALENLDLQMAVGVTSEVATNLAILCISIGILYCHQSKKRVEMKTLMNQQIDGPGSAVKATIERSIEMLMDIRKYTGDALSIRDFAVVGFLRINPKSTAILGKKTAHAF